MTDSIMYSDEQKSELSRLLAETLHEALQLDGARPMKVAKMTEMLLARLRKLDWFRYGRNEYGLLRHLEEAEVYGAFQFFPDALSTLYLRAVFDARFQDYVRKKRPGKEEFVRKFSAKTFSGANKPSQAAALGNTSAIGGFVRPNMRGMLSGR